MNVVAITSPGVSNGIPPTKLRADRRSVVQPVNAARKKAWKKAWNSAKYETRRALLRANAWLDPAIDLVDPNRRRYFPRDLDDLDSYRDRFRATARVFQPFLRRGRDDLPPASDDRRVAIVVMPWFGTPCAWYAIALGLGLARRGRAVTFVWHDLPLPDLALELQNDEIGRVLADIGASFEVVRLSDLEAGPRVGDADDILLADLTAQNLVWTQRAAQDLDADGERYRARIRDSLEAALPRVRALFRHRDLGYVIVPGGVLLASGLYLAVGTEAGVRVATFDAGLGWTVVGTRGVAAEQTDIPRGSLPSCPSPRRGRLRSFGKLAKSSIAVGSGPMRCSISTHGPVPLRSSTRSSFRSACTTTPRHWGVTTSSPTRGEWLVESITALLRETDDPIVVRQHPSERRPGERSRFDAASIVGDAFGANPQVHFVAAEEPHNTYDLLDSARLVLPFVSTIGIEAAALGKPVVVAGSVYYGDLGFVWAPSTRAEYHELLKRGAHGDLSVSPAQRERAWLCYYLNATCQRTFTNFTGQPPDYWRWVARRPKDLFEDPAVADILTALDEDVPLALLRHRRRT